MSTDAENDVFEIIAKNTGPITYARVPVPKRGGMVVLEGRNGVGKSELLRHIECITSGKGKGNVKDGEATGSVEAFGMTLRLGAKTTRHGKELFVESLEGRLNISKLIDPQINDPVAADAARIKVLVQLANVPAQPDLFHDICGGRDEFEKVVSGDTVEAKDLVVMAASIKRDIEKAARTSESQSEHAEGRARASHEIATKVDLTAPHDGAQLQANLEAAIREEARLKSEQLAAVKARQAIKLAKAKLEDADAAYSGLSVVDAKVLEEAAKANVVATETEVQSIEVAIKELQQKLALAQQQLKAEQQKRDSAISARKTAEQHEAMLAQCREEISKVAPIEPTAEMLEQAATEIARCREACDLGVLVRNAKEQLSESTKQLDLASQHRNRAEKLRDAAQAVDNVLSDVVSRSHKQLRVESGRLVVDTHGTKDFFHRLSAGQRARIAVDIGIACLPIDHPSILIIHQEQFEGLDPINREELAQHAVRRGVSIITARAERNEGIEAKVMSAATVIEGTAEVPLSSN